MRAEFGRRRSGRAAGRGVGPPARRAHHYPPRHGDGGARRADERPTYASVPADQASDPVTIIVLDAGRRIDAEAARAGHLAVVDRVLEALELARVGSSGPRSTS